MQSLFKLVHIYLSNHIILMPLTRHVLLLFLHLSMIFHILITKYIYFLNLQSEYMRIYLLFIVGNVALL